MARRCFVRQDTVSAGTPGQRFGGLPALAEKGISSTFHGEGGIGVLPLAGTGRDGLRRTIAEEGASAMKRPSTRNVTGPCVLCLLLAGARSSYAGNDPEAAQRFVEENVLPKIVLACGLPLSIAYDGPSLRKHNKDIDHDQTGGGSECNEPLRYIWYACQTDAGKKAVKQAHIAKVVCQGVPGGTGTLTLSAGTMTVGRAFEEAEPFRRSRRQFEALVKVPLRIDTADPYYDEAWHNLEQLPNPVTSTTTYCLVGGEKKELKDYASDCCGGKQDVKVKCWKDKQLVTDLEVVKGKKNGFLTRWNRKSVCRTSYRDGNEHGEQKCFDDGKLKTVGWYENGQRVWLKELRPDGGLESYSRKVGNMTAELHMLDDGTVAALRCSPEVRGDPVLHRPCGFDGAVTTSLYDGTGKVSRVQTWKDGMLQKEGPGTSAWGSRREVSYKDGKKHGEERILDEQGKLSATVTWDRGIKDGKETEYAEGGKKMVKVTLWKAGERKQVTELYLNGNPKLKESYDGANMKGQTFWDTGAVKSEGAFVRCPPQAYRAWCEDGVHRVHFENGSLESETNFRLGRREGVAKSWWENGKPAAVETFFDDKLTKAKRWDKDGKLLSDDEFEADGSRKVKR